MTSHTPLHALALLHHSAAYKEIEYSDTQQCWRRGTRRLKGVREALRKSFWPSYSYDEAERLTPTASSARVRTGVRGARHGLNRGSLIHAQLSEIAMHTYEGMCRLQRTKRRRPHPYVKRLYEQFQQIGWDIVDADVPVHNEQYGSAIDLVCLRRRTGKLILIELKTGGDNYYQKANALLEGAAASANMDNSPLTQAFVQLAAYRMLFEHCYNAVCPFDACVDSCRVVYAGHSGIHIEKLGEERWRRLRRPLAELLYGESGGAPNRR